MTQFKAGDVVRLKSGGPKMTVSVVRRDGSLDCDWFVGNDHKSGSFPADAVEAAPQSAPSQVRSSGGPSSGGGPWS